MFFINFKLIGKQCIPSNRLRKDTIGNQYNPSRVAFLAVFKETGFIQLSMA